MLGVNIICFYSYWEFIMEPLMSGKFEAHPNAVKHWERLNELSKELGQLAAHIEAATYQLYGDSRARQARRLG